MSIPYAKVIVNPTAGGGRVSKIWADEIKPLLDKRGVEYDFEMTKMLNKLLKWHVPALMKDTR